MPKIDITDETLQTLKTYSNEYRNRLKKKGLSDVAAYFDADILMFDAAVEYAISDSEELLKEPGVWEARLADLRKERSRMQREEDKTLL